VSKGYSDSLEKVPFTLSPHCWRNCRKLLCLSDWNAILLKVFDVFSFWFFVWLYWISLSKSKMKEICSFYEIKRNMERRITSMQSLSALLWSFLIPSSKWINQTRKAPLDIFSRFLEIWAAYYLVVNIRPFIHENINS